MSTSADALLALLPRIVLVLGKGGVGKTTTAAALALHASRQGRRTLLLTTDPARALAAVLDAPVGADATAIPYAPGLSARMLDANALRARFMQRHGDVIRLILDRGTYLDDSDIAPLVDTAMPGGDEIFAALALAELLAGSTGDERIVVDTAPTGHTLRLLQLPGTFRALVQLLDAMQGKHRYMVRALTRAYRPDAADAFLKELSGLVSALETTLTDATRCAAVMVTQEGSVVQEETRRYMEALRAARITVAATVWNAGAGARESIGVPAFHVPRLASPPVGAPGLDAWVRALRRVDDVSGTGPSGVPAPAGRSDASSALPPPDIAALLRPLTIVAGKGGVGKSTVATVLALVASDTHRTLVVSTDPAPSLGDVLGAPVGDSDMPVAGVPRLFARQMDASAAFARLRDEYRERVDAVFDGLVGSAIDLTSDRAIIRDLLALAPPGVDEVYALSIIADALFDDRYERVVVDPAPTGHLLRMLEMPQLALAWCHQLLRLMLKYKDIAGLGESAAELLDFSRKLRALDALLRDRERSGVVVVTLDEPVVQQETVRLATEVQRLGVSVSAVVTNRAKDARPLPDPRLPIHLQAPVAPHALVGVDALRRWGRSWTRPTIHATRG